MKLGLSSRGFTIVESMIFLAVSGGMLLMASLMISGQQAKTQFNQSVRNFESRLLDLANDISTGYYVRNGDFSCSSGSTAADIVILGVGPSAELGESNSCILVGQVVQLDIDTSDVTIYPLAGKKRTTSLGQVKEVKDLVESKPKSLIGYAKTAEQINYGSVVDSATYIDTGGVTVDVEGFLFATTFGSYAGAELGSGDIWVDLVPLSAGDLSDVDAINWATKVADTNPDSGITICLQDSPGGGAARHAKIILGGNGRQLTTKVEEMSTGVCT